MSTSILQYYNICYFLFNPIGYIIELMFIQDGRRHNDGYYRLSDWGPYDPEWVCSREDEIASTLHH